MVNLVSKKEVQLHGVEPDKDILSVIGSKAKTAKEIAEGMGMTEAGVSLKLKKLCDEGTLERKKYKGIIHYYIV